jgi:hypothetical protein
MSLPGQITDCTLVFECSLCDRPRRCTYCDDVFFRVVCMFSYFNMKTTHCILKEFLIAVSSTDRHHISYRPVVRISSHMNPVHTSKTFFSSTQWNIFPYVFFWDFLIGSFLRGFPSECCTHSSPMRVTCPIHLIFLYFIILIIFSEKYKS